MVKRRIDIARFECPTCGHWSTPPEAINAFPQQMEKYTELEAVQLPDSDADSALMNELNLNHYGNDFQIEAVRKADVAEQDLILNPELAPESYTKVVKVERSYCEVAYQSDTFLDESNHIVLSCPQCHAQLYEVKWGK